jgi:hypothetical protein
VTDIMFRYALPPRSNMISVTGQPLHKIDNR